MIFKKRLKPFAAVALTAVVISSLAAGCSAVKGVQDAACCKEFVVGQDMTSVDFGVDASVKGSFNAYAQATGDLSATASASGTVNAARTAVTMSKRRIRSTVSAPLMCWG